MSVAAPPVLRLTGSLLILQLLSTVGSQDLLCVTPDGEYGSCIDLTSCPTLTRKLSAGSEASIDLLRKSHCGFNGSMPKVCCEFDKGEQLHFPKDTSGTTTSTTTTSTTTTSRSVPSVGNSLVSQPQLPDRITGGAQQSEFSQEFSLPGNALPSTNVCGRGILDKFYRGNQTSIEDFPWTVLLKYRVESRENFGCGGVLINNRYVLTAAHCVMTPSKYKLIQVRLGEWNMETEVDCQEESHCNEPPLDVDVESTSVHPEFELRNLTNDVAVVRLQRSVFYSDWIQPICLPTSFDRDYTQHIFMVAGWGQTESGSNSPVKLKVWVENVDVNICSVRYRELNIPLSSAGNLCAGGRLGRDTCVGDLGGALMTVGRKSNFYAVGVLSLAPSRCGLEGWPSVYTKVSNYIDWIHSSLSP